MSRPTLDTDSLRTISLTGLSPSLAGLSRTFLLSSSIDCSVRTPGASTWFGLFRVRSPLLTESLLYLFLRLLRCFSSPGSLRLPMDSANGDRGLLCRVAPFRYLRLNVYLQLTAAFRSLSRLSSALSAKASALRPI